MREQAVTVTGAVIIPIILWLFYNAVKTEWPENYITASQDFGTVVNRSIGRYVLFRVAPSYCTTLVVATTVDRFRGSGMAAALVGAGAFVLLTQARHIVEVWRRVHGHRRLPMLIVSVAAGFGIMTAAVLGGLGPGPFVAVVPPIDEFFKSLWTTILLALIAVALIKYYRHETSTEVLVRRSQAEVGRHLLDFARETAHRHGTDPWLVDAILLTENLERPRWVRRVERAKAIVSPKGSYGIMQVQAERPISDEESIEHAVRDHLAGRLIERDGWGYSEEQLKDALSAYNSNPMFIELAVTIYAYIYSPNIDGPEEVLTAPQVESAQERQTLIDASYTAFQQCAQAGDGGRLAISRLPIEELRALQSIATQIARSVGPARSEAAPSPVSGTAGTGTQVPQPRAEDGTIS